MGQVMPTGAFTADGGRRDQKVPDLENIVDSAAHSQHDNRFEVVEIGQAINNKRRLGRADAKVNHRAVLVFVMDDPKITLGSLAIGFFLKAPDILLEIGDQDIG